MIPARRTSRFVRAVDGTLLVVRRVPEPRCVWCGDLDVRIVWVLGAGRILVCNPCHKARYAPKEGV